MNFLNKKETKICHNCGGLFEKDAPGKDVIVMNEFISNDNKKFEMWWFCERCKPKFDFVKVLYVPFYSVHFVYYRYYQLNELRVPLGKTIKQFSKETPCPICGCRGTIYEYGGAFLKDKE